MGTVKIIITMMIKEDLAKIDHSQHGRKNDVEKTI